MQDKALDAMAKKYKEEMMRLYAGGNRPSASEKPSASSHTPQTMTAKPNNGTVNGISQKPQEQTEKKDADRLMHPPMPQIPSISKKCEENASASESTQGGKFPSPEELMAAEKPQDTAQSSVSAEQNENTPRFDNVNEQSHEQGNYEFTEAEREQMFEDGEGYLKLEVSGGGQPLDCALAALFRVTDCGDVLTATFFTDAKGETEVITLPVLGLDEKYTVTVAKEGFFTVRDLEIPIFDSIKSIQPVELKQEQK